MLNENDPSTSSETSSSSTTSVFAALGLGDDLCEALAKAGYVTPTPIQKKAIPHVLDGQDVLGCAQTGTGKTAAFALPILEDLLADDVGKGRREIQALVLAPTRELAAQIHESFVTYAAGADIRSAVVFGGVSKGPQAQKIRRGVDVLIATPGRLLDLMNDRVIDLRHVHFFVLDEADRMLDMGFIHDVRRIGQAVPKDRQTLLFSATMPKEIEELASRLLYKPVRLAVDPVSSTVEPIEQSVYHVDKGRKTDLLKHLLESGEIDRALVFTRTKHGANRLVQKLARVSIEAAAIHGNKSQSARETALRNFKSGKTRVVVATDLAARGIDVKGLSHVINYELPNEPETYVHRIGRTGRAGESGIALSLCAKEERPHLAAIERLTRRRFDVIETPEGLVAETGNDDRDRGPRNQGNRGGARSNQSRSGSGGGSRRPRGRRSGAGRSNNGRNGSGDATADRERAAELREGRPGNRRPSGQGGGRSRSSEPKRGDESRSSRGGRRPSNGGSSRRGNGDSRRPAQP